MVDARNKIYRTEWKGKFTKWDYRLDVILPPLGYPGGLALDNPTIQPLPPGAIELKKSKVAYRDYIIGFPETPSMEIDINFNLLQNTVYDDLRNAIFEESPPMSKAWDFIAGTASFTVKSGVVFDLYIKFNGADEVLNNYRQVRTCIYQSDGKIKLDARNKIITIEAIDINRVILSSIKFSGEFAIGVSPRPTKITEIAWYVPPDGTLWDLINYDSNIHYTATSYQFFLDMINETANEIKKILVRDNAAELTLSAPPPTFYQQDISNQNGNKGSKLSAANLYILAGIWAVDENEAVDGLFHDSNKNSLQNLYPNGAYDFLSELAEFSLARATLGPAGIYFVPVAWDTFSIDLNDVKASSLELKYEQYKTFTSSCYEIKTDDEIGGDIDKIEVGIEGGKNEASWTIPIVFSNLSPHVKLKAKDANTKKCFSPKIHNFYYFQNPADTDTLTKVHEWARFNLYYYETGNKTSDDYNTFAAINREDNGLEGVDRTILATQTLQGVPLILANTVKALLQDGLDKVEIEVPIDKFVFFTGGGGGGFIWNIEQGLEHTFTLNIAEIFGIEYTKNNWKILSSEIDYFTETAKVELININV